MSADVIPFQFPPSGDVTSLVFADVIPFHFPPSGDVTSLVFTAGGRWLLSGSRDHDLKVWEVSTGTEIRSIPGNNSRN